MFTMEESAVRSLNRHRGVSPMAREQGVACGARTSCLLAESNYEVQFARRVRFPQRVLFPSTPSQSNGIEDARFVRFKNDDGNLTYYATYTAYDGKMILPQFMETPDFVHFKFITLNGPAVQNKGMALVPAQNQWPVRDAWPPGRRKHST